MLSPFPFALPLPPLPPKSGEKKLFLALAGLWRIQLFFSARIKSGILQFFDFSLTLKNVIHLRREESLQSKDHFGFMH